MEYMDIQYASLIPVDTSAPDWIQAVTYFSSDAVGQAQWFAGHAQDVPHVELTREKFQTGVNMAAIGYDYTLEELGTAQLLGMPLTADKATMARRAAEEFIDMNAFVGSPLKGTKGLVNHPAPLATLAPADGTAGSRMFRSQTIKPVLQGNHSPWLIGRNSQAAAEAVGRHRSPSMVGDPEVCHAPSQTRRPGSRFSRR